MVTIIPEIPDNEVQSIFLIVAGSLKTLQSLLVVIFYVLDNNFFYAQLVSFFIPQRDS